jgi:hypothetical protein
MRRSELRRQKLLVKRRELELTAAKNFLSPRLDALAQYRFRGFGDDLTGPGGPRFNNALDTLSSGDFQEWQLGVEFSMPIGFRRGHAAVQNAELLVARERAVLQEQERRVVHDLSNAIAEKDRAYLAAITTLERLKAADTLLRSLQQEEAQGRGGAGEGAVNLDRLLDAQRRVAEAEAEYYLNRTAYEVALKNVAFEKGSLLDYHDVYVTGSDESRTIQASATSVPPGPPAEGVPPTPAPVPEAAPLPEPEAPADQPPVEPANPFGSTSATSPETSPFASITRPWAGGEPVREIVPTIRPNGGFDAQLE